MLTQWESPGNYPYRTKIFHDVVSFVLHRNSRCLKFSLWILSNAEIIKYRAHATDCSGFDKIQTVADGTVTIP